MEKSEIIKNLTADSTLAIKKFEIKLEATQDQAKVISEKLSEKEKTITVLKNEIALYNEESYDLRKANEAMTY